MKNVFSTLIFIASVIGISHPTPQRNVDGKLRNVSPETENANENHRPCCGVPGMPGPIGPQGPKGDRGQTGEPGYCKQSSCKRTAAQLRDGDMEIAQISACNQLTSDSSTGLYRMKLARDDYFTVYCEMGINGGGYTFIPREILSRLDDKDIEKIFINKSDVLLRISRPDGSQPYTIISQFTDTGGLSLQLNKHDNEAKPVNAEALLSPYLYLNTLPSLIASNQSKAGFRSNDNAILYHNCDNSARNYFAFFSNPKEKKVSDYLDQDDYYERQGLAVNWRNSAVLPPSGSRMPLNFFLFTEIHYGGCGCYTSSDRWLRASSPAHGTAIGLR